MNKSPKELEAEIEFLTAELKRAHDDQFTVEVVRSFSYKLNVGNYESRDFFCSQKATCKLSQAELMSAALHDFCKQQVMRDVNAYQAELTREKTLKGRKLEIKDIAKDEAEHEAGNE